MEIETPPDFDRGVFCVKRDRKWVEMGGVLEHKDARVEEIDVPRCAYAATNTLSASAGSSMATNIAAG